MSGTASIQQAVLELVSLHTDFTQLIAEQTQEKELQTGKTCHAYTDGLLHSIKLHTDSGSEMTEVAAASLLSRELQQVLAGNTDKLLLTGDCQKAVAVYMDSVQHLQQAGRLSQQHYVKHINADGRLPIELVWLFHQRDLMPLEAYITCNLSRQGVIGRLAQDIATLSGVCGESEMKRRADIVTGLMQVLLMYGYSGASDSESAASKGLRKVSCALLDSVTKKSLQCDPDLCIYDFLSQPSDVPQENVKRYAARQLSVILSYRPQYKVADALHQQQSWSLAKTDACRIQGYRRLLEPFSAAEALAIVKHVMEEQEVNWRSVLTVTSVLLTTFEEASSMLQGLCRELLTSALEQTEVDGLITGFLLARQGALEGPHVFPTYQNWFYMLFGESHTTPAINKKTFGFLLKFLGDIVPYESVPCLKAHILKPPCVPPKCRPLLSDYLALAKTRLMDLGENLEESSIFNDTAVDGATEKVVGDVDLAVESYGKTGKIPASVMEASIFRKPYFVGRFLPCLLKPRPLPNPPDIRMRLIESLRLAEKIPKSLFSAYTKECQNMTTQLLQGVFTDNDEDMEDLTLSPWQQLTKSLDVLKSSVLSLDTPGLPLPTTLPAQLSIVYDKCCACVQIGGVQTQVLETHVDTSKPRVKQAYLKVTDTLLHSIGDILDCLTLHNNPQYKWLGQLVTTVTRIEEMCYTLCVRILDLITKQGFALSRPQISTVAAVCVHILSDIALSSIKVSGLTFVETLTSGLKLSGVQWLQFTFRFVVECLAHAVKSFPSVGFEQDTDNQAFIPLELCQMFLFLKCRLSYSSTLYLQQMEVAMVTATELAKSAELQHLWHAAKLDVKHWLNLELSVNSSDDLLSEQNRLRHCEDMIFGEFVQQRVADQDEKHWTLRLCTQVALGVLNTQKRVTTQGLCSCEGTGFPALNQTSQFRLEITSLLQRLILLMPATPRPLWLLELLSDLCQQSAGHTEAYHNSVCGLLSLSDLLPPYLMIVNSPHQREVTDVNALALFINTTWRDFSTEGCVLTKSRTLYLCQAILTTQHLSCDWLMVARQCPLVMASLQYHWSDVQTLFDHSPITESLTEILQPIRTLHTSCTTSPSTEVTLPQNVHPVHTSTALMSLLHRDDSITVEHVVSMATQWDCFSSLSGALLCDIASRLLHSKPPDKKTCDLLVTMVTTDPLSISLDSRQYSDLCPETVTSLWPFVMLRVFQELPTSKTSEVNQNSQCLSLLLKCHVLCTGLYNSDMQSTGPLSVLYSQVQPLSLQFLLQSSDWLKQRLTESLACVRSQIDRAVSVQCDPDIRSFVSR